MEQKPSVTCQQFAVPAALTCAAPPPTHTVTSKEGSQEKRLVPNQMQQPCISEDSLTWVIYPGIQTRPPGSTLTQQRAGMFREPSDTTCGLPNLAGIIHPCSAH